MVFMSATAYYFTDSYQMVRARRRLSACARILGYTLIFWVFMNGLTVILRPNARAIIKVKNGRP